MSRLLSALGLYSFCLYLGSSLAQVAGLYTLQDAYEGPSFLDGFDFFTVGIHCFFFSVFLVCLHVG